MFEVVLHFCSRKCCQLNVVVIALKTCLPIIAMSINKT
jgi:hypothetical protein